MDVHVRWFMRREEEKLWTPIEKADSIRLETHYNKWKQEEASSKVVISTERLFEADFEEMKMKPIYWKDKFVNIRRGLWFLSDEKGNTPLDEDLSVEIEKDYQSQLCWLRNETPDDSQVIEKSTIALFGELENNALVYRKGFTNKLYVSFIKPSASSQMRTAFKSIISGKVDSDVRKDVWLIRGFENCVIFKNYQNESIPIHFADDIDHLILVVHGIGQKLSQTYDSFNFINDVSSMRSNFRSSAEKLGVDAYKCQLLPISWRLEMNLPFEKENENDNATFDTVLKSLIVTNIPALRTIASDMLMDILIYMTPSCGKLMVESMVKEMNRVYDLFLQYHPNFNGKVSVIAHSLGSVLTFDALSPSTPVKPHFQIENFFSIGSPIGLFLLLNNGKFVDREQSLSLLSCNQYFNLFHPQDPIATRIEPLIDHSMADSKPVHIPYSKGGLTKFTIAMASNLNRLSTSMGHFMRHHADKDDPLNPWISLLNKNGRLDYQLHEGVLENSYISSIKAHVCYWNEPDISSFLLQVITNSYAVGKGEK